jgi:hypothetical protein
MRDDFPLSTKDVLAKRVAFRCSNPGCRQPTSGPQIDPTKTINLGVAAHITAASGDGPRYDSSFTPEMRSAITNGIWLCQTCAKQVDNDPARYSVSLLQQWKQSAERFALTDLETRSHATSGNDKFLRLDKLMPALLLEMQQDLLQYPLRREFVLLKRGTIYNGESLCYYYDDHPDLDGAMDILVNYGLVLNITYNDAKRFRMSEELVQYLVG